MSGQIAHLGGSPSSLQKRKFFAGAIDMSRTQTSDNLDFTTFLIPTQSPDVAASRKVTQNLSSTNDNLLLGVGLQK
jgi:hypothetical protein